jgi:hypothetical protein
MKRRERKEQRRDAGPDRRSGHVKRMQVRKEHRQWDGQQHEQVVRVHAAGDPREQHARDICRGLKVRRRRTSRRVLLHHRERIVMPAGELESKDVCWRVAQDRGRDEEREGDRQRRGESHETA